jgi:hypothetical protein
LIAEVVSGWAAGKRFQTIKAGRRKLSGKKSSKTLAFAGELPIHISGSGAGGSFQISACHSKRGFFLPLVSAPRRLIEI